MVRTIACYVTLMGALMMFSRSAPAAVVRGQVQNMSREGQPVAGVEVTLRGLRGAEIAYRATTKTDQRGAFRFANVPGDTSFVYRIEVPFAGLRQISDPFGVHQQAVTRTVAVYDTTGSAEAISIERAHLIIAPDAASSVVGVTAVYVVDNAGPIYVGDPPDAQGRRLGVRFFLPDNASDFRPQRGLLAMHSAATPWGFASTMPFYPGSDTVVFTYLLPWADGRTEFEVKSPYPIGLLNVVTMAQAAELEVEGAALAPSPMGPQLVNYEREDIPPNTPVHVRVVLPGAGIGMTTGKWLLIIAVIAMVAVILFAVSMRQKGRPSPAGEQELEEGASEEIPPAEADALVEEIAKLDAAYERDEIAEAEYVARRRELKRQLMQALKEEGA